MKHEESTVKIFKTIDYEKFKKLDGNRSVNLAKVKKIIKAIDDGVDILKYAPVIVDEKMQVVDGQHRLEVSKRLKRTVHYVVLKKEKASISEVARMNSNTSNWTSRDFLNSYCKLKNKEYLDLQKFVEAYGFTIGVSVVLLGKGEFKQGGDVIMIDFKEGLFKVNHYDKAYDIAEKCEMFKSTVKGCYSRGFAHAIMKLMDADKVKWDRLVSKMKGLYSLHKLEASNRYKDNLELLESAYNKGSHTRNPIY